MLTIKIKSKDVEQRLTKLARAIDLGAIKLMKNIRTQLVKAQRQRFKSGNDGKWRSLASLTRRKTGRTQPLQGLEHRVTGQHDRVSARVIFRNTKDWTIEQHDKGFTSPPVNGKFMSVRFFGRGGVSFTKREASRIPARPIWLEQGKVSEIVERAIAAWAKREMK